MLLGDSGRVRESASSPECWSVWGAVDADGSGASSADSEVAEASNAELEISDEDREGRKEEGAVLGSDPDEHRRSMLLGRGMNDESRRRVLCHSSD